MKIILARALAKDAQGQPLTAREENLIAELYRRKYERYEEKIVVDADGNVRVVKKLDAEPVMQAMKAYGDFIDGYTSRKHHKKMVGSIDPITAYRWMQETGLKIGTKEFAKFAVNRIKNDIDFRGFRVGG